MDLSDQLREQWLDLPKPERFDPDEIGFEASMAAHASAVESGQAGYVDPVSGLFVMTATYLRDRGPCCDCGCRHCPFL